MPADFYSNLAINIFPVIIAAVAVLYKVTMQYLPTTKQEHLKSQVDNLASVADTVVSGIEQSMAGSPGAEKKAQAANDIEAILNATGIKVAPELVSHAIEAAVYSLNLYKPLKAAAAQPARVVNVTPVVAAVAAAENAKPASESCNSESSNAGSLS